MKLCAIILLVCGVPVEDDTPEAAVERIAESVRKGELAAAYEQLGDGGKRLLDGKLAGMARALGLDAGASPSEVLKAMEQRLAADEAAQRILGAFSATVVTSSVDGDKASAKVRVRYAGREEELTMLLALDGGTWRVDGIDESVARMRANELAAIATLRNVTAAQAQFQAVGRADANANGVGEYGFFGELSGAVGVRGGKKLNPPVLSSAFRKVEKGVVTRSGYHFRVFLCGKKGKALGEDEDVAKVDANLAQTTWCAYAWPVEYGKTGKRSFFVNQFGDVLAVDAEAYSGKKGPAPDAAFAQTEPAGTITGKTALGAAARDGRPWKHAG